MVILAASPGRLTLRQKNGYSRANCSVEGQDDPSTVFILRVEVILQRRSFSHSLSLRHGFTIPCIKSAIGNYLNCINSQLRI